MVKLTCVENFCQILLRGVPSPVNIQCFVHVEAGSFVPQGTVRYHGALHNGEVVLCLLEEVNHQIALRVSKRHCSETKVKCTKFT